MSLRVTIAHLPGEWVVLATAQSTDGWGYPSMMRQYDGAVGVVEHVHMEALTKAQHLPRFVYTVQLQANDGNMGIWLPAPPLVNVRDDEVKPHPYLRSTT